MTDIENEALGRLWALQDLAYRDFQIKLVPNVPADAIIGVRTPELRKLAKQFAKEDKARDYLRITSHKYYDENNLHGLLIETLKDFDDIISALDAFLPHIDNWATCDIISPKRLAKQPEKLLVKIRQWISAEHTYTVRFGLEMLMSFFLDERFKPEYLDMAADIRSDEYYVNMMKAWFFATALAKQYESALVYLQSRRLDVWSHNKSIQKAVESYRITDAQKTYLRTLKIKQDDAKQTIFNN